MSITLTGHSSVLVIGIGNTLLSDDGFGVHVIEEIRSSLETVDAIKIVDGGTIGLNLLPDIEDNDHLIVVDAAEMGLPPGALRVLCDEHMDEHLSRHKSTVHEVAMSDLLCAARLSGHSPHTRCLIAVQPGSLDWGLSPTEPVQAAIADACNLVISRIEELRS
jgi:hydrogenase maturation protease